jgi:hypothetical protein
LREIFIASAPTRVLLLQFFIVRPFFFLQAGLDLDGDGVDDGVGGNAAGGGRGRANKTKNKAQARRGETALSSSDDMDAARASPLHLTWAYATSWLNLVKKP